MKFDIRTQDPGEGFRRAGARYSPGNVEKGKCTMPTEGSILGNAVLRREDPTLLTGAGKYYDDMRRRPHARVLRPVVGRPRHAQLGRRQRGRVDARRRRRPLGRHVRAGAVPGVPDDAARHRTGRSLAKGKVRFVGDIVAAVVAETQAQAVDAAEAVVVDYDPLPAVIDRRGGRRRRTRRCCSRSTGRTSCFATEFGPRTAIRSRAPPTWPR